MKQAVARAVALACAASVGSPVAGAPGLKCSVKVAKKDGLVSITARGVVGTLLWGAKIGDETSEFFNAEACGKGTKWRQCVLADPASVAARTPPADCTLYLRDDAATCAVWVPGCTPGLRVNGEGPIDPDLAAALQRIEALEAAASDHATRLTDLEGGVIIPADLKSTLDDHTARIDTLDTLVAGHTGSIEELAADAFSQGTQLSRLNTTVTAYEPQWAQISVLSGAVDQLSTTTRCLKQEGDTNLVVEGCNLRIRNGLGTTYGQANGTGNLIVGYDTGAPDTKSGSHNIVVGDAHTYTGRGGFVAGTINTISGFGSTVTGGRGNQATGEDASISGGNQNIASGQQSSISGGYKNVATGRRASVTAGNQNTASGDSSSVAGGLNNLASGANASVTGGNENTVTGAQAAITGGYKNVAIGNNASVTGGQENTASGNEASVSGGNHNIANGQLAAVSGGQANTASGIVSSISGGISNMTTAFYNSISGGQCNYTGSGAPPACVLNEFEVSAASITGGLGNVASNHEASVCGGYYNVASGEQATVSGGQQNKATGFNASVSGGGGNEANGALSSVSGGTFNEAGGQAASVAGGDTVTSNLQAAFVAGNSWFQTVTITSDRKEKEGLTAIAPVEVLNRVASLPIGEWQYKSQPGVRHVGPMAQDFRAAFQVGVNDKGIATVDADGVALAAIQGLHALVERQQQELDRLSARLQELCK